MANPPRVLIVAQAELLDDDPTAREWLSQVETVIYAGLFDDGISEQSDFLLPLQSFAERDGSFVNGERRAQRFYTAQGPMGQALPAWKLFGGVMQAAGMGNLKPSAAAVMLELSRSVEAFAGADFRAISQTERQFPDVGGRDLYYGGTAYANDGGVGVQIASEADKGETSQFDIVDEGGNATGEGELLIMPVTRLYNRQRAFRPSLLMEPRILDASAIINPEDAAERGIIDGDYVEIVAGASKLRMNAAVSAEISPGAVAVPRHMTDSPAPLMPTAGTISRVSERVAVPA